MTTDLSTTSSEVVETNSLREVLLFCAVLLVEIYSLAVSFGGPFFEVGYFLLVVISQTFAGAYIWAQLRKSDVNLPLPELLAMGFAIGSASAAISQLIIRDLLGIRLFLSPLIPIIGVAIWLITKRNPQLPVTITHANTNTLLWLLFPAPLALMTYSIVMFPVFVAPISLGIWFAFRKSKFPPKITWSLFTCLSLLSVSASIILRVYLNAFTKSSIGIDPYSDDIRFDVIQSVGFAKWGLNTNVELINHPDAYYKLSHLWVAPIMNFDGQSLMNVSITVLPIFLILITGLSFYAFTQQLSNNPLAASVASCFFFIQTDFNETFSSSLRSVWLLAGIYLMTFGILTMRKAKTVKIERELFPLVAGFIISATRIFFAPFMISMIFLNRNRKGKTLNSYLTKEFLTISLILIGILISIFIFSNGADSSLLSLMTIRAADWPVSSLTTLNFVINATMPRVGLLIVTLIALDKYKRFQIYILIASTIFIFLQFFSPRVFAYDNYLLAPYMMTLTPIFSVLILDIYENLRNKTRLISMFLISSVLIGFVLKTLHDVTQNNLHYNSIFKNLIYKLISTDDLINLVLLIGCTLLALLSTKYLKLLHENLLLSLVFLAVLASGVGVRLGIQTRPITEFLRYGEIFWGGERDALLVRWEDDQLLTGLKTVNLMTSENDVIASNFGLHRSGVIEDGNRPQVVAPRRYYISGRFQYFSRSLPLVFKEKYSLISIQDDKLNSFAEIIRSRIETSMDFPNYPSRDLLANMQKENVKWFVVDLTNTTLRSWEPWATTRFMNEKVAILELANGPMPEPSD